MNVVDWVNIDSPVLEIDGFIDAILDKSNILTILDKYGVEYTPCRTGEFTHKAKCPLPVHFFGEERTASFFVSEEKNKFYCFGCNSGGSIIDLVSLYEGKPFYEAVQYLAIKFGLTKDNIDITVSEKKNKDPEKRVFTHVFRSGLIIRDHLYRVKNKKDFNKWCRWADKRFEKLDQFLDQLEDKDWEIVKQYHDKIINYIKRES